MVRILSTVAPYLSDSHGCARETDGGTKDVCSRLSNSWCGNTRGTYELGATNRLHRPGWKNLCEAIAIKDWLQVSMVQVPRDDGGREQNCADTRTRIRKTQSTKTRGVSVVQAAENPILSRRARRVGEASMPIVPAKGEDRGKSFTGLPIAKFFRAFSGK
jgi:hypothetical protein